MTLTTALQLLDEKAGTYSTLDQYWAGEQPLAFLSPEAKTALGTRMGRMVSNIPRLAVNSLAERLRVVSFYRGNQADPELWGDWLRNNLDQLSGMAHREALALGKAYILVWADGRGRPKITIESARQVAAVRDPGTGMVVEAVKRWEAGGATHAVHFFPDRILRYKSPALGATTAGFTLQNSIENPFGMPPMVELTNTDRLLADGVSEMTDLMPLCDGLNKLLADMMVTSEYTGRARRWASGIELEEDEDGNAVNPFPEGHRMMISEQPEAKFGQLPAADLSGYGEAVKVLLSQIEAVSSLPAHYLGVQANQPPSADALRASESSLTAKAEARQAVFGRAWEQVGSLVHAVRTGTDPMEAGVRVKWADPATRSVAQEADAVVKLHQAGLLPASYALSRLGYSDDEVKAIRAARRAEALDQAGTDLTAILP